jgi:hypothetical protein
MAHHTACMSSPARWLTTPRVRAKRCSPPRVRAKLGSTSLAPCRLVRVRRVDAANVATLAIALTVAAAISVAAVAPAALVLAVAISCRTVAVARVAVAVVPVAARRARALIAIVPTVVAVATGRARASIAIVPTVVPIAAGRARASIAIALRVTIALLAKVVPATAAAVQAAAAVALAAALAAPAVRRSLLEILVQLVVLVDPSPRNNRDTTLLHVERCDGVLALRSLLREDPMLPQEVDVPGRMARVERPRGAGEARGARVAGACGSEGWRRQGARPPYLPKVYVDPSGTVSESMMFLWLPPDTAGE